MSLKKIYSLTEETAEDDVSDGVPTQQMPVKPRTNLSRLFQGAKAPAGEGPTSNGIPQRIGGHDGPVFRARGPEGTKAMPGTPIELDRTVPIASRDGQDVTIPNPRPNLGGSGAPPKSGGAFSRAPNAPPEEPLPDLPLESRLQRAFGMRTKLEVPRRSGKLLEFYTMSEMPRPPGAFGGPVMAMLKWAKESGGREFTARDLFKVWRQAGGQPNQGDDRKAYMSFQTSVRQFIDPRGRGTPEQPLVVVQAGVRGRGGAAIYKWGGVRPSATAAAKPQPGATEFDDMELGPAGAPMTLARKPQQPAPEEPEDGEPEEFEPDETGSEEPGEEPAGEPSGDEFDWVPEPSEETQVGRSMIALQERDPEKLQDLLMAVQDSKTVLDAGMKAIQIFGRGTVLGSHAIRVAKTAAANLGLPDPDEAL